MTERELSFISAKNSAAALLAPETQNQIDQIRAFFTVLLWYATGNPFVVFDPKGDGTTTVKPGVLGPYKLSDYADQFGILANTARIQGMITALEAAIGSQPSDNTYVVKKDEAPVAINYGLALTVVGELFTKLTQGTYGGVRLALAYPVDVSCTAVDILGMVPQPK